ncbi:ArsR/SmtB family transcription factor [Methanosalsum natronophilum]|uniref:ArsR/SmtB family transcription factor n=1 Tax=Methanosalsum natronophilum TaxID=768733 RepID=UPI002167AAA7|nr:winged helix-turn-helix domain-containing protein [Methanosalsum natronophilum]MCS3924368.1 DNA-binding transcriptional ArsR family regulator [Methanosalsum natronophilum]
MNENDENSSSVNLEKIVVIPIGDSSKRVAQALSNDKSLKILELLAESPMSASSISEELKIPLTTVKYNLDSLFQTGLIKVKEKKWSRKGREIKIYEPVEKLIVLAPSAKSKENVSVKGILQKYLGAFLAVGAFALVIEYISRIVGIFEVPFEEDSVGIMREHNDDMIPAPSAPEYASEPFNGLIFSDIVYSTGFWFFIGGIVALLMLIIWELYIKNNLREKGKK